MAPTIVNLVIGFLILGLTYALTSEGLWGSAQMFFNVLFGAMIAFNFYEPLANLVDSTGIGWGFSDTLCLLGLFCVVTVLLRMTTETIAPAQVRFPMPVYHMGRLVFGLGGAIVTMSVLLLGFHTAPVHKKIFNVIDYQSKPPFGWGLDHKFLGFFQNTTGAAFARYGVGRRDPFQEFGNGRGGERYPVNFFDPKGDWLILHQDARPYGEGAVLLGDEAAGEAEGAAGAAQPAAGGAQPGGARGKQGRGGGGRGDGPPN
jgi:hypothetical protein